jgi:hypothetical protein
MLDLFIHQLCNELGMEELAPLEKGHYRLSFANEVAVELFQLQQSYLIKGVIGPTPTQNQEPFFSKLMEANLFARGTRGAAIGLQPETDLLMLSLELANNCTYTHFKEKLEDFISVLEFWRAAKP